MTTLTLHISPWLAMIVIWPYVSCCSGFRIGIKLSHSEEDAGAVSDLRLAGNADHTFIKTELEYVTKQVFSVDRQKSGATRLCSQLLGVICTWDPRCCIIWESSGRT